MGRTLETYRIFLEKEKAVWTRHLRVSKTSKQTQNLLESALKRAQWYADAATFWKLGQVKEKIIFSMFFSQFKELLEMETKKRQ
jgi:hypothetical protein